MKYQGSCHCQKVRYEVELDLSAEVYACNCSMCQKRGTLLAFAPWDQFKLLSGEKDLTQYNFNKHVIDHLFCSTCGILGHARGKTPDGKQMAAINVRCLDGIEISDLKIKQIDGRSF